MQNYFSAKCRNRTDVQSECARVSEGDGERQMGAISAKVLLGQEEPNAYTFPRVAVRNSQQVWHPLRAKVYTRRAARSGLKTRLGASPRQMACQDSHNPHLWRGRDQHAAATLPRKAWRSPKTANRGPLPPLLPVAAPVPTVMAAAVGSAAVAASAAASRTQQGNSGCFDA